MNSLRLSLQFLTFWLNKLSPFILIFWVLAIGIQVVLWIANFDWLSHQKNLVGFLVIGAIEAVFFSIIARVIKRLKNTVLHGLFLVLLLIPATIGLICMFSL